MTADDAGAAQNYTLHIEIPVAEEAESLGGSEIGRPLDQIKRRRSCFVPV